MPVYRRLGQVPSKRHTVFPKPDGSLYYEQLFGTEGFSGMSSLLYHHHRPTMIKQLGGSIDVSPKIAVEKNIVPRKLLAFEAVPHEDYLESRLPLLTNSDLIIGVAAPLASVSSYYYKNGDSDELLFVHKGSGKLKTPMGCIDFVSGDYILIPRGTIHQIHFDNSDNRLLYIESHSPVYFPKRYRNQFGQLLEHAPFCERDLKLPENLEVHNELGDFTIKVKKQNVLHHLVYAAHPFDVIGWDGYNYPYAFSIHDFEPITGRVHQPPPVHQNFEGHNFVVCSFCPRLYDYHPKAIPAPYNHSNIDSDEVLYYVDGDFMSRNDIAQGNITLHPAGIPHGPHPGAVERSIGKRETMELAVMIDTFRPLMLTQDAMGLDDGTYYKSWLD